MKDSHVWCLLRDARYALPGALGRIVPAPGAARAVALARRDMAATIGYFEGAAGDPAAILTAYAHVAQLARAAPLDLYLSVKAPPLGFAMDRLRLLAGQSGLPILLDAHGPGDADRTLDLVERLLPDFPGTGCVLPARWRRSPADAARFRDTSARIRIVKGEWPDPDPDSGADSDAAFLALARVLAGRRAPVAVATHRPALAARALALLKDSRTPCELEQLRGLPGRRCRAVARALNVPVRRYIPFGPGWVPYAIDRVLARPHLPLWLLRDWLGRADP